MDYLEISIQTDSDCECTIGISMPEWVRLSLPEHSEHKLMRQELNKSWGYNRRNDDMPNSDKNGYNYLTCMTMNRLIAELTAIRDTLETVGISYIFGE